jgi:transposase
MFSASQKMRYAQEGYNSEMKFDSQFNLMYLYSPRLTQPVFYSLFAGNIREVKSFKFCLQESGLQDAVVVADKGFYSKKNIEALEQEQLRYIIPLRRDNLLIEYGRLNRTQINYFSYEQRYIWYTSYVTGGREIYLFKDEKLKVQEEKDYLDRIESLPEYYNLPAFHKKTMVFGTIAMLSNIKDRDPASIFATYKSRNNVELMFDGLKNVLNADRTYMQNEDALQGWMFINHIALQWYYILYSLLKEHKLLKHYSVRDFIIHLYELKKIKINEDWVREPTTKKTETLLEKLKISIT